MILLYHFSFTMTHFLSKSYYIWTSFNGIKLMLSLSLCSKATHISIQEQLRDLLKLEMTKPSKCGFFNSALHGIFILPNSASIRDSIHANNLHLWFFLIAIRNKYQFEDMQYFFFSGCPWIGTSYGRIL